MNYSNNQNDSGTADAELRSVEADYRAGRMDALGQPATQEHLLQRLSIAAELQEHVLQLTNGIVQQSQSDDEPLHVMVTGITRSSLEKGFLFSGRTPTDITANQPGPNNGGTPTHSNQSGAAGKGILRDNNSNNNDLMLNDIGSLTLAGASNENNNNLNSSANAATSGSHPFLGGPDKTTAELHDLAFENLSAHFDSIEKKMGEMHKIMQDAHRCINAISDVLRKTHDP